MDWNQILHGQAPTAYLLNSYSSFKTRPKQEIQSKLYVDLTHSEWSHLKSWG